MLGVFLLSKYLLMNERGLSENEENALCKNHRKSY